MVSGFVQKAVCLLLLDEGQMTTQQMHERIHVNRNTIARAANKLVEDAVATREERSDNLGRARLLYGLTKQGIEDALKIDPAALLELERKAT